MQKYLISNQGSSSTKAKVTESFSALFASLQSNKRADIVEAVDSKFLDNLDVHNPLTIIVYG